jgi:uncharacterized protein YgbK (DUF1537 family)
MEHIVRFGVVADDLTGAMDTGLQFRRAGLRTAVRLALPAEEETEQADVLVVDTESRGDPADAAYEKARRAARSLRGRAVYKKIDSTLRGNVGQELDGVMDGLDVARALVTPAFPAAGRTVLGGRLSVRGVPLRETDFVEDSLCPPTDHVPSLLRRQSRRPVGHVGLDLVEKGVGALVEAVGERVEEILVADATRHRHLVVLSAAANRLGGGWLLCGSAGLARALPEGFDLRPDNALPLQHTGGGRPALVIAGSRRRVTVRQIQRALSAGSAHLVELDPVDLERMEDEASSRAIDHLANGDDVIITAALRPYAPERSGALSRSLGRIAAEVMARQQLGGLVLTGGATALSVCRALGVRSIEIDEEVSAGIPAGRALSEDWPEVTLITKAGGFGEEDTLVKAIEHIRGQDEG